MLYFPNATGIGRGLPRLSLLAETFIVHCREPRLLWRRYRQHGAEADFLLAVRLFEFGDISDRVFSDSRVCNSVGVVPLIMQLLIMQLYTMMGRQKTGFGHGPGGLRHLMRLLNQRERTHDIYAMTPDELIQILPPKFERWNGLPLSAC